MLRSCASEILLSGPEKLGLLQARIDLDTKKLLWRTALAKLRMSLAESVLLEKVLGRLVLL